jgi:glycosyltransferase involved in cell wall biosynthesis
VEFSIFIPVHNGEAWLAGAIESVLAQTHHEWELVIGDNASDDGTPGVVARYDDPRIRYRRWSDKVGIFDSYNRTAALTRLPWVQELAADDRLDRECLSVLAERIRGYSGGPSRRLAMVLTAARRVDAAGQRVDVRYYGFEGRQPLADGCYDAAGWLRAVCTPGSPAWNFGSAAISREVLDQLGRYVRDDDPIMSTDLELALTVAAYGDVIYVDRPLLDVSAWPESDSHGRHARDRTEERPLTARGAALLAGLLVHEQRRTVTAAERRMVYAAIARTNLQRAAGQRYLPGGGGRAAALRDVIRACRFSPRTMLSPARLVRATVVVIAPRSMVVGLRQRALDRRSRRASARGSA